MSILGQEAAAFVQSQSERTIPLLGKYVTKVPARVVSVSGTAPNQKAVVATPDQIAALASGEITEIPRPAMPVYGTVVVDQWVWCLADAAGLHIMGTPGGGGSGSGTPGTDGNTILNGSGAPANATGKNGDFYLDTANSRLYGPRTGGVWPGSYISLVGPVGAAGLRPGHISGANLEWVSSSSVRVTPGEAMVNGTLLSWSSNLTLTGISGAANTVRYVYLEAGPTLSHSTTAPVYDAALDYWKSGTDASKRCVGFVRLNPSGTVYNFTCLSNGRIREYYAIPPSGVSAVDLLTMIQLVGGANNTASWMSLSLTAHAPAHATHWFAAAKLAYTAASQDGGIGLSPVDLGSSVGAFAMYTVRDSNGISGGKTFFGRAWIPLSTAQTAYSRLQSFAGNPTYEVECHGARYPV